jgi:hypothetical protein
MTGKERFERDLRAMIEAECRRRKIGRGRVIWAVVWICNQMLDGHIMRVLKGENERNRR